MISAAAATGKAPSQMTTTRETTYQMQRTRFPAKPAQIEMTDPKVADQVNKRTVGIRQLHDLYTVRRLEKQNALNRELVARLQQQLPAGNGQATTPAAEESEADMSDLDDLDDDPGGEHVTVGDTTYNISLTDPSEITRVLREIRDTAPVPQEPTPAPSEPEPQPAPQEPAPQPAPAPAPQPPPPQPPQHAATTPDSPWKRALPWIVAATLGTAGAGTAGYLAGRGPDTDTRYRLEFDEPSAPADAVIPTPPIEE